MTVVTGGLVSYERSVKVAEYENKKLRIELSFAVPDGEDPQAALDQVGDQAVAFVHDKLGIATTGARRVAPVKVEAASGTGSKEATAAALKKEAEKAKPKPPGKKTTEAPSEEVSFDDVGTGQAISTGGERTEPEVDPLADLLGTAAPEITDKELVDAVGKKMAAINNAIAIRQVIGKFAGQPPKTLKDVPQDKRAAFLKDLNAL